MSTDHDEATVYKDLKEFLLHERSDLRLAATQAVLQSTTAASNSDGDLEAMSKLIRHGVVECLAKNVSYQDHQQVAVNALQALVYLSSHGPSANQCLQDLMDAGGMTRMVEVVLSSPPPPPQRQQDDNDNNDNINVWRTRINYAMALMANMTRTEAGAVEFVGKTLPDQAVVVLSSATTSSSSSINDEEKKRPSTTPKPTLHLLLARFLNPIYQQQQQQQPSSSSSSSLDYDSAVALENANAASTVLDNASQTTNDPYQHFAAVLHNSTQVQLCRDFLLLLKHDDDDDNDDSSSNCNCVLKSLLPQLKSPNPIRRRGIAGTIRNCLLNNSNNNNNNNNRKDDDDDSDATTTLMNDLKLQTHLLYPLAGPEELDVDEKQGLDPDLWLQGPDKKREPDHQTRLFLVESILLLLLCGAGGRKARERLRLDRAYVILKYADMVEEHEDVSAVINECVQFLRRDEEGTQEGSSDKFVQDAYRKPTVARQVGATEEEEDFDNVD